MKPQCDLLWSTKMISLPRFGYIRRRIHQALEQKGWLVRRIQGLPAGVDLVWDINHRLRLPLRIIIDIGAHKGETVQYFHDRLPECQILAFEPVSATFNKLSEEWGLTKNVHLRNVALAETKGFATIYLNRDSQSNSLNCTPGVGADEITEKVEVSCLDTEVDALFRDQQIDLVKIDVEGVETRVIQGAKNLLNNKRISLVIVEFTIDPKDAQHTQLDDLMSLFEPHGFSLVGFYDQVIWNDPPRLGFANALFALSP